MNKFDFFSLLLVDCERPRHSMAMASVHCFIGIAKRIRGVEDRNGGYYKTKGDC